MPSDVRDRLARMFDVFERKAREHRDDILRERRKYRPTPQARGRKFVIHVSPLKPRNVEEYDDREFITYVRKHEILVRAYQVRGTQLLRLEPPPEAPDIDVFLTVPTVLYLRRGTDLDGLDYTPSIAYAYGHLRYVLHDAWDDIENTMELIDQAFRRYGRDFASVEVK